MSSRNLRSFLEGFSSEVLGCYSVFPHLPTAMVNQWKQVGAQSCCSCEHQDCLMAVVKR